MKFTKLAGKEGNKVVKIAITHLEMGPETPQPLPACDVQLDKSMSCPFKGLTQTEEPQYKDDTSPQ